MNKTERKDLINGLYEQKNAISSLAMLGVASLNLKESSNIDECVEALADCLNAEALCSWYSLDKDKLNALRDMAFFDVATYSKKYGIAMPTLMRKVMRYRADNLKFVIPTNDFSSFPKGLENLYEATIAKDGNSEELSVTYMGWMVMLFGTNGDEIMTAFEKKYL